METFYEQHGVARTKYLVCYHNGIATHKDGSPFFDIAIFKNKKKLKIFIDKLKAQGYTER